MATGGNETSNRATAPRLESKSFKLLLYDTIRRRFQGQVLLRGIAYHTDDMVHAFVMVKTAVGASEGMIEELRSYEPITEAHIVAGDHDIIAEVDVAEVYDVLETVAGDVRDLEGVTDTRTYISLQ